jgi:hypothetical protein
VVQVDALSKGVDILLYERDPSTGDEVLVGGTAVPLVLWGIEEEDSYMQNTTEYMAVIIGLSTVLSYMLGGPGRSVILRGDSKTALSWAEKGRVRSDRSARLACLFTLVLARSGLRICDTDHALAEVNATPGLLSRRDERGQHRSMGEVIPEARDLALYAKECVRAAVYLCDPKKGPLKKDSFEDFWKEAGRLVASVLQG